MQLVLHFPVFSFHSTDIATNKHHSVLNTLLYLQFKIYTFASSSFANFFHSLVTTFSFPREVVSESSLSLFCTLPWMTEDPFWFEWILLVSWLFRTLLRVGLELPIIIFTSFPAGISMARDTPVATRLDKDRAAEMKKINKITLHINPYLMMEWEQCFRAWVRVQGVG